MLSDQTADERRLRSVLHDWGYSEKEIQRLLSEMSTPTQHSPIKYVNAPLPQRVITPVS